jgi:hypothetical protein
MGDTLGLVDASSRRQSTLASAPPANLTPWPLSRPDLSPIWFHGERSSLPANWKTKQIPLYLLHPLVP